MWRQIYNFFNSETYVIFQFLVPVLMTYTVPFLYINVIGQLANPVKKNVWGGLNFFGNIFIVKI